MNRKGFTLIELLIAASLGTLLLLTAYHALGGGLRAWKKLQKETESLQINTVITARIIRDIRSAKTILPSSTSKQLLLKQEADIVSYDLEKQKVRRKKNNSTAYLTEEGEIKFLGFAYPTGKLVEIKADTFTSKAYVRTP